MHVYARPLVVAVALVSLLLAAVGSAPEGTYAAARELTPACSNVNLRTGLSTRTPVKARVSPGATVRVIASVIGARWRTDCSGWVAGSRWLRISHVNGTPVPTLFGVRYLYAASGTLQAGPAAVPVPPAPPRLPEPVPSATPTPTPTPTPAPATPPASALGATVGAVPVADQTADPLGADLMRLINLDRTALGLAPYPIDPELARIARDAPFACPTDPSMVVYGRASDLATRGYLTHTVKGCQAPGTTVDYRSLDVVRTIFGYTGARSEILHWNTRGTAPASYRVGCDISATSCVGGIVPTVQAVAIAQRSFMSSSPHRRSQLNSYERFGCGAANTPGTTRWYFACVFSNGGPAGSSVILAPASGLEPPASPANDPVPAAPAGVSMTAACADVNVRSGTSTGAPVKARISPGAVATVAGTVIGTAWATECPGPVSGNGWHQITHLNGTAVQTLYGVPYLYAATGVLAAFAGG